MKVLLVTMNFLSAMIVPMWSFSEIEFDFPIISSMIRLDHRTSNKILMHLENETRASMSLVRQVNEYCFRYRLFHGRCTRVVGLLADDIHSMFHGMLHDYAHTSFQRNAWPLLVS